MQEEASFSKALKIVWIIISVVIVLLILLFYLFPGLSIYLPPCPSKLVGESCSLCGMSRGFLAILKGDLEAANQYNAASIYLFLIMLLNFVLLIILLPKLFKH